MAQLYVNVPEWQGEMPMPARGTFSTDASGVLVVKNQATGEPWYWFSPGAWQMVDFRADERPRPALAQPTPGDNQDMWLAVERIEIDGEQP